MATAIDPAPVLTPARLRYHDDQPYSLDYGDIYHAADGAAEVRRVFIGPCGLDTLARARARAGAGWVRVGELGFGSGLNFVIAAEACLAAGARLHFVSCEAHPISADDFAVIAARRSARHPLYRELAATYPPLLGGWHRRRLAGGRVQLSLWLGEARAALDDLHGRQQQPLDAWFLDGFAPDRNAALWQEALLQDLAGLSRPGARVATFTAAGRVRRALAAAGFAMARVDQRPHKRESLAGTFQGRGLPGFQPPAEVLVIGAGLAGASAARHLAEAGCRVRVADPANSLQPVPAARAPASTMPATVLHARLLADRSVTAALRAHAYGYASTWVRDRPGFTATGVLQLAGESQPPERLQALAAHYGGGGLMTWLDAAQTADLAGWPTGAGGLHFAAGGHVDLPRLVESLLDHPDIERGPESVTGLPDGMPVILAAGADTRTFPEAGYLELAPVHGQLDLVDLDAAPRLPLVGSRYLVPVPGGVACGSTYEYRPWDPDRATAANLHQLAGHGYRWRARYRGTRSVSSDRTAIAGPLYHADGAALEHRYVTTGHGSAGNVSAHLAGALLAARITGDCAPMARTLESALSPWRFRERQARRGFRHGV